MAGVLTFGDLTFPGQSGGVYFDALSSEAGTSWGAADALVREVEAFLQDGAVAATDRFGNRDLTVRVRLTALTSSDLAAGEALLVAERRKCDPVGGMNTMTWTPPDGGPTSVFDVVSARLDLDFDDQAEVGYDGAPPLYRYYQLTLTALPYAASVDPVTTTVPAPPGSVTTASVDNGSSTTGWTGSSAPSVLAGAVHASGSQRVNIVPNPSFEVNTSGWTANLVTLARVTGVAQSGSACLRYTTQYNAVPAFWTPNNVMAITAGQTYTASCYVRAASVARTAQLQLRFYNSSGTQIGATASSAAVAESTSTWNRLTVTAAAPAGATRAYLLVLLTNSITWPAGEHHYADSFLLEKAGSAGTYFDGSLPAAGDLTYGWTGAAHNSSSTETKRTYLQRSGLAVAMAGTPYLRVVAGGPTITGWLVNGGAATVVAQSGTTYWLDASAVPTLNTLRVDYADHADGWVDDVSRTNSVTVGSTGRQNARQVDVAGSARSQASLSLYDPASALGSVLLYTTTDLDAHQPNLRQFLQAGPTITADGTTVSGGTSPLATLHHFDLPADGVTAGGYLLLARVKVNSIASEYAANLSWSAVSMMGSTAVGSVQSGTAALWFDQPYEWEIVTAAMLNLPPTRVGTGGKVRIALQTDVALDLDEAWLFNLDTGRLTWVECGTTAPAAGGSSNRLWLDSASVADPKPSIWKGTTADRSDAVHAGPYTSAWGVHEFAPPAINVFTVTGNSTAAELTLTHYPRWHTHAAA